MNIVLITPKYPPPSFGSGDQDRTDQSASTKDSFGRGGIGLHVAHLAKAFAKLGETVTVIAYAPGHDGITEEHGVTVSRTSLSDEHPGLYPETQEDIAYLRERFAARMDELFSTACRVPDVIHCHDQTVFPLAAELKRRTGAPVISTVHYFMSDSRYVNQESVSEATRIGEETVFRSSDRRIAVSRWLRDSIMATFGVSGSAIEVIHHGVESPLEANLAKHWRRKIAPQGARIIAYIGRLSSEKGFQPHLDAARIVLQRVKDVCYAVAGGTREELDLFRTKISDDPVLCGRLHLLGWLGEEHLNGLREASYMVVVPSLYESFGYTAIEALASGVPVVATNVGGLPEIVIDGECGLLVEVSRGKGHTQLSPAALAAQQIRLLNEPELRERFADAALSRARRYFDVERMLSATLDIYRDVAQMSASGI